jgi:hypothetical protein
LRQVALIAFFLHASLVSPAFFPSFGEVGWDEALYFNEGRKLFEHGTLPLFAESPAMAAVYALTYLPVQGSPDWMVHSATSGRLILFCLLWLATFLVAVELVGWASPFTLFALVTLSPAVVRLNQVGPDALFPAMSGFALWLLLAFQRAGALRHLRLASFFVGLAALSRGEALVLFPVFVGLALVSGARDRSAIQRLIACVVPFAIVVFAYVLLYTLRTGDLRTGLAERSYLNFEQGHAAQAASNGTSAIYIEGELEARRIFGTAEENRHSVLNAIRRNPVAYLKRIPPLTKRAIGDAAGGYFWYFGFLCFAFAARGIVALIARRSYLLLTTLLLWSAYAVLYVLVVSRPTHLLMPFLSVFALAAVGVSAFSCKIQSRPERYMWTAVPLLLAVAAAATGRVPSGPFTAALVTLFGFLLIWAANDFYAVDHESRAIACLLLLSIAIVLRFGIQPTVTQGTSGSDAARGGSHFLAAQFAPGSNIAAWSPQSVWNAKMSFVQMAGTLRELKSPTDVWAWLERDRVHAIYVDDQLRQFEPVVWDLMHKQVGNGLAVGYESVDGEVQVLVRRGR